MFLVNKFLVSLFICVVISGHSIGQSLIEVEKTMTCLKVDDRLIAELQPLINKEKTCTHYKPSLIWHIGIAEVKEETFVLDVTMQSEVSKNHEYLGYFYLNEVLFIVSGPLIENLFERREEKVLEFKISTAEIPDIEDYSTWVYLFENGILSLKEKYPLPCD